MSQKEALNRVEERIAVLQRLPGQQQLVVIVGRGSHSRDGISKLRPAVSQLMDRYMFSVERDKPNVGCLLVTFDGKKEFRGNWWDACSIL
jgi:hypothetical protein